MLLLLTLAFEGDHKDLVYSSSTSKLADYLASGRPILVHAPPGCVPGLVRPSPPMRPGR